MGYNNADFCFASRREQGATIREDENNMSASREKKQRQTDGTLDQRQRKSDSQAAQAKRKRIGYTVIGAVIVVLVAALLIWDTGIVQRSLAKSTVALSVDGQDFYAADLDYYYYNNYTYQMMLSYGLIDDSKLKTTSYDENQTWHEFLTQYAIDTLTNDVAACKQAEAEGITLSEDSQAEIDSTIEQVRSYASSYGYSYENYLRLAYGDYMTPDAFQRCLERNTLAAQYQESWAGAQSYSDSDLEAYYTENADDLDTYHYDYYLVDGGADSTTDEEGNTVEPTDEEKEAAKTAARELADQLAAALKDGGDVAALLEGDVTVTTNEDVTYAGSALSSVYGDWLKEAGRAAGDVTVAESEDNYYVVVFRSREDYRQVDGYLPANVRHIFIQAEVTDGSDGPTDEQMEAARTEAQNLLDQWAAGDATAESFAALAEEHSDDGGSNTNGGLYEGITKSTSFIEGFLDWTFEDGRQPGDTGLVENTTSGGWHVMYLDSFGDTPVWETAVINTLNSEGYTARLEELSSALTVTQGDLSYVG